MFNKLAKNENGDISIFTCFFILGIIMLISFVLTFFSVQINSINIRNGAKMELNNLSATIYADTYHSQRETNFSEYLKTLYQSSEFEKEMENLVTNGLASKISLSNDDYTISNIELDFEIDGDKILYVFICDVEFYINMFGNRYNVFNDEIQLTGYHNTKF